MLEVLSKILPFMIVIYSSCAKRMNLNKFNDDNVWILCDLELLFDYYLSNIIDRNSKKAWHFNKKKNKNK